MKRIPLIAALFLSSALYADATGHWVGKITTPQKEIAIEVDLTKNANGELAGTFNNPGQNIKGFPLSNLSLQNASVAFELKTPGGGMFRGTIAENTISGDFSAGAMSFPFSLTRTGDAVIDATPKSPAIAKELEGTWTGTAEDMGRKREVTFRMTNHADGTASGVVLTPQGTEIPISRIVKKGSAVTLEVKIVGGAFEGTLSADGTELSGMWLAAEIEAPLTLRRTSR